MKKDKLLELFNSLTLEEKIGQLVQLNPDFLNESDTVHTVFANVIGEKELGGYGDFEYLHVEALED